MIKNMPEIKNLAYYKRKEEERKIKAREYSRNYYHNKKNKSSSDISLDYRVYTREALNKLTPEMREVIMKALHLEESKLL